MDSVAHYQQVLRTATFRSTVFRSPGTDIPITFTVNDGLSDSTPVHSIVTYYVPGSSAVAGRNVFYNNSGFDGGDPAANASDDAAIASDKTALLRGDMTTFANVTSYDKGINGVAIDLAGQFSTPSVHTGLTATDFTFKVGSDNSPANWANAPAPSSVVVLTGAGSGGTDRVEITWPDGVIANTFLQVTLKADGHSGLAAADSFYFGNLIGDSGFGNDPGWAETDVVDFLMARAVDESNVAVTQPFDFDRSGTVDVADWLLSRAHAGSELELISLGAGPSTSPAVASPAAIPQPDASREASGIAFALATQSAEGSGPSAQSMPDAIRDELSVPPDPIVRTSRAALDPAALAAAFASGRKDASPAANPNRADLQDAAISNSLDLLLAEAN